MGLSCRLIDDSRLWAAVNRAYRVTMAELFPSTPTMPSLWNDNRLDTRVLIPERRIAYKPPQDFEPGIQIRTKRGRVKLKLTQFRRRQYRYVDLVHTGAGPRNLGLAKR